MKKFGGLKLEYYEIDIFDFFPVFIKTKTLDPFEDRSLSVAYLFSFHSIPRILGTEKRGKRWYYEMIYEKDDRIDLLFESGV